MTLQGFSQTDTAKKAKGNIDPSALICLPDSIVRKAAADLKRYDDAVLILGHMQDNDAILNNELRFKDSVIKEKKVQLAQCQGSLTTWKNKYAFSQADNQALKEDYSHLKSKDRNKMIVLGCFALTFLCGWATKK